MEGAEQNTGEMEGAEQNTGEMEGAEQNEGAGERGDAEKNEGSEVEPPGLRFHPTDQELLGYYLKKMDQGKLHHFEYIQKLDVYSYDPWDLPRSSRWSEDRFFFVPRDKKCQKRGRFSRITASGFWKTTGSDRTVREHGKPIGQKKTLVFYKGRTHRAEKTNWVMNEYRMLEAQESEIVLCRIQRKDTPFDSLDQRAITQAAEAENSMDCKSQETSMVSSKETCSLTMSVEDDEVRKPHQFEASSSLEKYTATDTDTDVTSSKFCEDDEVRKPNEFEASSSMGKYTATDTDTDVTSSKFCDGVDQIFDFRKELDDPCANILDFGSDYGVGCSGSGYGFGDSDAGSNVDFDFDFDGGYPFSGSDAG